MAPTLHLSINQVMEIMSYFPGPECVGYLRVQVLLALFSTIVDLEHVSFWEFK